MTTVVREKPILFSAPMIRAILNGKTQTRRILKPQPPYEWLRPVVSDTGEVLAYCDPDPTGVFCPYGVPGDRLWVRETWAVPEWYDELPPRDIPSIDHDAPRRNLDGPVRQRLWYPADSLLANRSLSRGDTGFMGKTRVSIHMPRWASRLTLEIESVRVERVQDISEADARAEGISDGGCLTCGNSEPCGCSDPKPDARESFAYLWDSVNGPGAWERNDFVWAISFRRLP